MLRAVENNESIDLARKIAPLRIRSRQVSAERAKSSDVGVEQEWDVTGDETFRPKGDERSQRPVDDQPVQDLDPVFLKGFGEVHPRSSIQRTAQLLGGCWARGGGSD